MEGGKAYTLEECDPRLVYCNVLDHVAPLGQVYRG